MFRLRSRWIQIALYLLPQVFQRPFYILMAVDFQASCFVIVVIYPSLTSANPFFLLPERNQTLNITSSMSGESLVFVHLESWKLKTTFWCFFFFPLSLSFLKDPTSCKNLFFSPTESLKKNLLLPLIHQSLVCRALTLF